jgi:hypothetical protein
LPDINWLVPAPVEAGVWNDNPANHLLQNIIDISEFLTMAKAKQLSKKQLAVIEDLFSGELGEQAVLDKFKVSRNLYNKWLANEVFTEQFDQRIAGAYRQSTALIARHAPLAAAKLVQLTESEKAETARKACLDIISFPSHTGSLSNAAPASVKDSELQKDSPELSPETAGRLLVVLAEERNNQ